MADHRRVRRVKVLHVLDTTHPAMIRHSLEFLDLRKTMFIVSSKSGTTLETLSHLNFFWEQTGGNSRQFIAITDPGSPLEGQARQRDFRASFAGEPTIGGRYSALSPFAVAVAGTILEVNVFDQPDVQAAKDKTQEVLASGEDPSLEPEGSLDELLAHAQPPCYVAIQAFIDPMRERELQPLVARARETG